MQRVVILMVGKTRARFIQEGIAVFQKRLRPYLKLSLQTVREEKPRPGITPDQIREKEAQRLLRQLPHPARVVTLEVDGRLMRSEEFAQWLTGLEQVSPAPVVFVIGGHLGLSPAVRAVAQDRLSLSRLTFTHELSRLLLMEQLYRAMTIRAGHPYHL